MPVTGLFLQVHKHHKKQAIVSAVAAAFAPLHVPLPVAVDLVQQVGCKRGRQATVVQSATPAKRHCTRFVGGIDD